MNTENDLNFVNSVLSDSESTSYPAIYALWGVIVLAGFTLAEFKPDLLLAYWTAASILGFALSAWLGYRTSSKLGQRDRSLGNQYMMHFGMMTICIFIAVFTQAHQSILLLIGLAYILAGIHLERAMLSVGIITLLAHIFVFLDIINSNLVLGLVISAGLFVAAWSSHARSK